jgi:hypothetical protein
VQGQGCELRGVCSAAAKRHVDGMGPLARERDSMGIPRIFIVDESEGIVISSVLGDSSMKGERMELDKWADGRPILASVMAQSIVMIADGMVDLAGLVRQRATLGDRKIVPDSGQWFRMYEQSDLAIRGTCAMCLAGEGVDQPDEEANALYDDLTRLQHECETVPYLGELRIMQRMRFVRLLNLGQRWARREYNIHIKEIHAALSGTDSFNDEAASKYIDRPEPRFFLLVTLPCWIEYKRSPKAMMRKVSAGKKGHVDAACNLLRLDSTLIGYGPVHELYRRAHCERNEETIKKMETALRGVPKGKVKARGVKIALAALIFKAFREFEELRSNIVRELGKVGVKAPKVKELKVPDVQRLFDALAQDRWRLGGRIGPRILVDVDLHDSAHSFDKVMRDSLPLWPKNPIVSQESIFAL